VSSQIGAKLEQAATGKIRFQVQERSALLSEGKSGITSQKHARLSFKQRHHVNKSIYFLPFECSLFNARFALARRFCLAARSDPAPARFELPVLDVGEARLERAGTWHGCFSTFVCHLGADGLPSRTETRAHCAQYEYHSPCARRGGGAGEANSVGDFPRAAAQPLQHSWRSPQQLQHAHDQACC
jgi:hypothetical protein